MSCTLQAFAAALQALNMNAMQLLAQPQLVASVLRYHVTTTLFASPAQLAAASSFTTLNGKTLAVSSR